MPEKLAAYDMLEILCKKSERGRDLLCKVDHKVRVHVHFNVEQMDRGSHTVVESSNRTDHALTPVDVAISICMYAVNGKVHSLAGCVGKTGYGELSSFMRRNVAGKLAKMLLVIGSISPEVRGEFL